MKKLFYLMLATIMLSSCATGMYLPGKSHLGLNTNVVLSQANYRIVRNLEVTVEINNSNLKRVDVEKSAYAELLRQANLTGSQALANVVVEEVRRENMNLFGFIKHKQYVSAYASIIEFLDDSGNPIPSVTKYAQPTEEPIEQPTEEPIEQPTEQPTKRPTAQLPQQTSNKPHIIAEYQDVLLIHKQINNAQMSITDERFQICKYYNKLFSEIRSGRISCTDLDMFKIQYIVKQCVDRKIDNEDISTLMQKLKNAESTEEYQAIFIQEYDSLQ